MKEEYTKPVMKTEVAFDAQTGGISLFARCWGISYGDQSSQIPNCKEG